MKLFIFTSMIEVKGSTSTHFNDDGIVSLCLTSEEEANEFHTQLGKYAIG